MTGDTGERTALERIASALEREIARRDAEEASKAAESRRTQWAVIFLIYIVPLAWMIASLNNPKGLDYWTSDPTRVVIVLTIAGTAAAAIVQAVRIDAFTVGGIAFFVVLMMAIGLAEIWQSGREEYVIFGIFYGYLGLRLLLGYWRTSRPIDPVEQARIRNTAASRFVSGFTSVIPLIALTPYVVYTFMHRWDVGNLAAIVIAIVSIVVWIVLSRRKGSALTPEPAPEASPPQSPTK
jgi:hypothetical protein